jgi:hypothetical protein
LVSRPTGQSRCRYYALAALHELLDTREQRLRDLPLETIAPGVVEALRSSDAEEFAAACQVHLHYFPLSLRLLVRLIRIISLCLWSTGLSP